VFGVSPSFEDLRWEGLDFSREAFDRVSSMDAAAWRTEFDLHGELFDRLRDRLPSRLEAKRREFAASVGA
jgi:phosphoenolpyruvate carboxykinase (GTP)